MTLSKWGWLSGRAIRFCVEAGVGFCVFTFGFRLPVVVGLLPVRAKAVILLPICGLVAASSRWLVGVTLRGKLSGGNGCYMAVFDRVIGCNYVAKIVLHWLSMVYRVFAMLLQ